MTIITIERAILDRLIDAWDSTVLPKSRDGMMQERMEDLRAALAAPATSPEKCGHCGRRTIDPPWPVRTAPTTDDRHALQAAGTHPAPCARHCEAKAFELEIRGRKADTVRADQALLAQDITLQNMAERHAQELCAYQITVDKLQPERKPLKFNEMDQIVRAAQIAFCLDKVDSTEVAIIRAVEAHHGIVPAPEDKT